MRKVLTLILVVLAVTAIFTGITNMMLSKAAPAFVPVKWKHLPLGEKRSAVYEYLGSPMYEQGMLSHWKERIERNKIYTLDMRFNTDSVAVYYHVGYVARVMGISFEKDVYSDSLQ